MSIQDEKKRLRHLYRERGENLPAEYRRSADRAIRERLLGSERWKQAESVFIFVSVGAEPDTRALIEEALRAGKRVYVPLCRAKGVMEAVRISGLSELRPGALGIPEPTGEGESAAPGELSLAVVPCVSATVAGVRLGHGAGYYDRFLQRNGCATVCLCYERMLADALPTDDHDVRMDCVLTEAAAYQTAAEGKT